MRYWVKLISPTSEDVFMVIVNQFLEETALDGDEVVNIEYKVHKDQDSVRYSALILYKEIPKND